MIRLLSDQTFRGTLVRGLLNAQPSLDVVRVQDIGLSGADDGFVLERAAQAGRVLLTHDLKTMPRYAYERVRAGLPMPGVFAVRQTAPIRTVIADLIVLIGCGLEDEWEGQVRYIPL